MAISSKRTSGPVIIEGLDLVIAIPSPQILRSMEEVPN